MGLLDNVELAPERVTTRNLVVLLLDTSQSMGWPRPVQMDGEEREVVPIEELQGAVSRFVVEDIPRIKHVAHEGEVAIGTFPSVTNRVNWHDLGTASAAAPFHFARNLQFEETLTAKGTTPMGTAIMSGVKAIQDRHRSMANEQPAKASTKKSILFLITDGRPEGETDGRLAEARELLREAETAKDRCLLFFAVATSGSSDADVKTLQSLSAGGEDAVFDLREHPLRDVLRIVSMSINASHSSGTEAAVAAGVARGPEHEAAAAKRSTRQLVQRIFEQQSGW